MRPWLALAAALVAGQATAQDRGWTFAATTYLWFPRTTLLASTPNGTVESEISVRDALETLKFGFMGAVEARRGRWGLIGDVIYSSTEDSAADPAPGFARAEVDSTSAIATAYLSYRVAETARADLDLALGFRGFRLTTDVSLTAQGGASRSADVEDEWVDAVVGARVGYAFTDRWRGTLLVDVGGLGGGSDSAFQGLATASYRISDRWSASAGYRHIESDRGDDVGDLDVTVSGVVLGATYRF